jgi:hypothetical protein
MFPQAHFFQDLLSELMYFGRLFIRERMGTIAQEHTGVRR